MNALAVRADFSAPLSRDLHEWRTPAEKIGGKVFAGESFVIEVLHVTYQQKSHIFGSIAPTVSMGLKGDSFVYGGGGFVNTVHSSVVTLIARTSDGKETRLELPADIAAREGSIIRIDEINGRAIAARNISGYGETYLLTNPAAYFPLLPYTKRHWGSLILAAFVWAAAPLVLILPASRFLQRRSAKRNQAALGEYMGRITRG